MRKTIGILLSAILVPYDIVHSASPDAWTAHYRQVVSSCIKASGLSDARPAGVPVDFDDRVGYTAIVIQGHYPQPHMEDRNGRVLCLFEKRSRTPYVADADAMIRSRKP